MSKITINIPIKGVFLNPMLFAGDVYLNNVKCDIVGADVENPDAYGGFGCVNLDVKIPDELSFNGSMNVIEGLEALSRAQKRNSKREEKARLEEVTKQKLRNKIERLNKKLEKMESDEMHEIRIVELFRDVYAEDLNTGETVKITSSSFPAVMNGKTVNVSIFRALSHCGHGAGMLPSCEILVDGKRVLSAVVEASKKDYNPDGCADEIEK